MKPREIRTLVCKRDLPIALLCFASLHAALGEQLQLVIHEDGSLGDADVASLSSSFPSSRIVRRASAEEEILEKLRHYPKCRDYRQRHPISNKLLDIPLLTSERLNFVDADVLFFRKVPGLFSDEAATVFMFEDDEGHTAPLLHLLRAGIRLPAGFNAGLFSFDLDRHYDLDRIEWLLGREDLMVQIGMADQTCFADLVGRGELRYFSPRQFFCSKFAPIKVGARTLAVHFIYHLKSRIESYHAEALESIRRCEPGEIEFIPARPLTVFDVIKRRAMRRFRALSAQ